MTPRLMPQLIRVCAAVAFAALPLAASAQDTVKSGGDVARTPTFIALLAALKDTERATAAIRANSAIRANQVRVVNAATLITPANRAELEAALKTHAPHLEALRTLAAETPGIVAAMAAQDGKLAAADIVAAEVLNDKSVVIYFRK